MSQSGLCECIYGSVSPSFYTSLPGPYSTLIFHTFTISQNLVKLFLWFQKKKMHIYIERDFLSYPSYDTTSHDSNVHREDGMSLSSPGWE